jgi:hypothetical protein
VTVGGAKWILDTTSASGDLRNVVKMLAILPSGYNHNIEIVINDRDLEIVARNSIFFLLAMVIEDVDEAAECMIHVWYSSHIRESDLNIFQHRIRPLVEAVYEKIKHKPSSRLLERRGNLRRGPSKLSCRNRLRTFCCSFATYPPG